MSIQLSPTGCNCKNCPAARAKPRYVLSEGPSTAKLVIIGEAPGIDEELDGNPFVGRSGKLLNNLLRQAGVRRSDVYITNVLKCRPLKKITPEMIECCKPNLLLELAPFADARILAMGGSARDALFPDMCGKSVTSTVGYWHQAGEIRTRHVLRSTPMLHGGFDKLEVEYSTTQLNNDVLLTWHPAYVLRNPNAVRDLAEDIKRWARGPRSFLPTDVRFLETSEEVMQVLYDLDHDRPIAIDLETSGYSPFADYVLCVSMSQEEGVGYVFPGELLDDDAIHGLMLSHTWIGHNFKFDSEFLQSQHGIHLNLVFDTMLAHYCFDERSGTHALKYLVSRLWDVFDYEAPMLEKYLKKKSESFALIIERGGRQELFTYAATDADYTWRLYELYKPMLEARGWMERPFGVLVDAARMYTESEVRGFNIDMDELDRLEDRYTDIMAEKRRELSEIIGWEDFNPASSKQAAVALFDEFKFASPNVRSRGSGRAAVNPRTTCSEALEELEKIDDTGFVHGIREYRRASKMRGTYVRNLRKAVLRDGDGRFHSRVRIHGTVTGRLSSKMIMLIPRRAARWKGEEYGRWIKNLFIPSEGMVLFDADYSQIELRLFGWYSEDPYLLKVYEEDRDLHNEVSTSLWGPNFSKGQRWIAKQVNYAYVYGGTEQSFGAGGDLPQDIAVQVIRMYDEIMPTAVAWREEQFRTVQRQGYVETPIGRRRRWPLVTASNARDVFKQAVNAPIQGLASDLTLISAIRLWKDPEFRALGGHVLVTVHDSVVGEVPIENAERCAEIIEATMLEVPREIIGDYPMGVDVGFGFAWGNMHGTEYDDASLTDFLYRLKDEHKA
jgi:DNA polymerase-1